MSRENVEVVRQAVEANRSDGRESRVEANVALWDPSCEYTSVTAAVDPHTYRGHDGIRRYLRDQADRWAEWQSDAEAIIDVSPDTVLATVHFHAIGKQSGAAVEARLGVVFVVANGKLVRGHTYPSLDEALEAVGLSD
jgi:ketosteroid isomerase-like protein